MSAIYAKRFEVVFLCSHPKGPKMSVGQAANYTKKSQSFVRKWIQRYRESNSVDDLPRSGAKRKTTKREEKQIINLYSTKPMLSLRQGQQILKNKGIHVSTETLRSRLRDHDIKFRSVIKKPLLTQNHVKKRIAWAKENLERDWSNVVFTDEASFWARSTISHTWSKSRKRFVIRTVKHPIKIHVWGCFSKQGFGNLYAFNFNLNAEKMIKIYKNALLPSARNMFGKKSENWVLQEDNDPKHRSRLCSKWKEDNDINVLDWPSQSPDANPIENVWGYIKCKLRGKKVFSEKQLVKHIRAIWRSLPQDYAIKLVESMPTRCQAIINNAGDWTPY